MARRILAIDYGAKRIGLARAEEGVKVAMPWRVLERDHLSPVELIRQLVVAEGFTDLVVGLPRSLEGNETEQTSTVRQFAHDLETLGLPVILQDEALTSQTVPARPGQPNDDVAAAQILQDYLDAR